MTELRYEVTENDLAALSEYHLRASPLLRRKMLLYTFLAPAGLFLLGIALSLRDQRWEGVIISGIFAVAWGAIAPFRVRSRVRKNAIELYREGANRTLLGEQTLVATETGLVSHSLGLDSRIDWSAVEKVASTEEHTFIYLSALSAIVIPSGRIRSGNYGELVDAVRARVTRSVV